MPAAICRCPSTAIASAEGRVNAIATIHHACAAATPGFRLYLLSLLLCQHHYLVANAQERRIPLRELEGTFTVITSADWILEQVTGDFRLQLDTNAFSDERMKLCPVSRNLPHSVEKRMELIEGLKNEKFQSRRMLKRSTAPQTHSRLALTRGVEEQDW